MSGRAVNRVVVGLGLLVASGNIAFGAADFWNKKQPSEWSAAEIQALKTKSPWAKKTYAEVTGVSGAKGTEGGGGGGGRGGRGGGTSGAADFSSPSGGGGGGRGGGSTSGAGEFETPSAAQGPELTIRWETAKPVLEATKTQIPAALENRYVISVSGLPPPMLQGLLSGGRGAGRQGGRLGGRGGGRAPANPNAEASPDAPPSPADPAAQQKEVVDRLLHTATLSVKGHDPENPDVVRTMNDGQTLVFGFSKENFPLAASDKAVEFLMKIGPTTVKVKFVPKEMMYRGDLAL